MENTITTYSTLWNLVNIDKNDHKLKDIATLFLNAMNHWPTYKQTEISDFIKEIKICFGSPLTIEKIGNIKFNGANASQVEAGSSIAELIDISKRFNNQSDFDKIINSLLNYYKEEFKTVDFIAELQYLTAEQGGRKTSTISGYRPQIKFDFTEIQTSGQQTFIDVETVYPGDKVIAKIKILSQECFANSLIEGMNFEFSEGTKLIGRGQIKYMVNDKLEKACT